MLFLLKRCDLTKDEFSLVDDSWKYYDYLKEPKNKYKLKILYDLVIKHGCLVDGVTWSFPKESSEDTIGHAKLMALF